MNDVLSNACQMFIKAWVHFKWHWLAWTGSHSAGIQPADNIGHGFSYIHWYFGHSIGPQFIFPCLMFNLAVPTTPPPLQSHWYSLHNNINLWLEHQIPCLTVDNSGPLRY